MKTVEIKIKHHKNSGRFEMNCMIERERKNQSTDSKGATGDDYSLADPTETPLLVLLPPGLVFFS